MSEVKPLLPKCVQLHPDEPRTHNSAVYILAVALIGFFSFINVTWESQIVLSATDSKSFMYRVSHEANSNIYTVYAPDDSDKLRYMLCVFILYFHYVHRKFAQGSYHINVHGNGWNYLDVENIKSSNDEDYLISMGAVGFLEGYLTCNHTKQYYLNFVHA